MNRPADLESVLGQALGGFRKVGWMHLAGQFGHGSALSYPAVHGTTAERPVE